jgi:hypothetical protein
VGFAYRLTLLRRLSAGPAGQAYARIIRRNLALFLLAFVIYPLGSGWNSWSQIAGGEVSQVLAREFKRGVFQTLAHIAATSLWVLPVMAARPAVRIAFAAASAGLHLFLSYKFNYVWVHTDPVGISGGPLGFLSWTVPLLAGSLAYDALQRGSWPALRGCLLWGMILMAAGYGMSCLKLAPASSPPAGGLSFHVATPPFIHNPAKPPDNNLFTMSLRCASVPYLIFAAGLSLAIYAAFIGICDIGGYQFPILGTLGANALAGYILHELVGTAVSPYLPNDAPLWFVLGMTGIYMGICWLFLRHMERERLFLRL